MKAKTQAQLDKATDVRLRKTYNISLKDYEHLLKLGHGGCWICGRPAATKRLAVDHDHAWKKVEIFTQSPTDIENLSERWYAVAEYGSEIYEACGKKKSEAVREVKRQLLRASVRGLLCYQHNSGLQKFSDNRAWLENAAKYLNSFLKTSPLTGREVT